MTPYRSLVAARERDAFLRLEVEPDAVERAWTKGDAVVWLAPSAYHGKPWLTGLGPDGPVLDLMLGALADPATALAAGISLPPAELEGLPSRWRPERVERWTWWWTLRPPQPDPDPGLVLLRDDDARLPGLLGQSASVYLHPGDPRVRAWYGMQEGDRLLACLAVEYHHPSVPHLASVVVDGEARGNGYGRRLCGSVVALLLAGGAPAVSLAMMTANRPAAALYRGLGFSRGPSFASGTLPGRRDVPVAPGWRQTPRSGAG